MSSLFLKKFQERATFHGQKNVPLCNHFYHQKRLLIYLHVQYDSYSKNITANPMTSLTIRECDEGGALMGSKL